MRPRRFKPAAVVGVLAVAAIALGTGGWLLDDKPLSDALYRSLQAFTLSDGYSGVAGMPDRVTRLLLEAARGIGALLAFYAVLLLLWTNLAGWRIAWRARRARGHLIVIGDSPFADRLSEAASRGGTGLAVLQLRGPDQPADASGRMIRLPFHGFDRDELDAVGAARAGWLVVAMADNGTTMDLSLAARRRYPVLPILARLTDGWLARELYDLPGGQTLRAFSEYEESAREIVQRHPLFLLGQDSGQHRIHALVIGDGEWVEALLAEIILSSRTLTFGTPEVSLVVADPDALRRRLCARYPEIDREALLRYLPVDPATGVFPDDPAVDMTSVTAAYCAFDDGARSLSTALALRRQAPRWPGWRAPIFVRVSGDRGLARPVAGHRLQPWEIVPFGATGDVIAAAGLVSLGANTAERAWHEAYLALDPDSEAAVPWDRLNEDYRRSNRRAITHIYAKLFEAGFDLRPWLATARPWNTLPALAPGQALFRDEAELMRLAEVEHERWNADRRLLGWRYGDRKDETLKHHPCLKSFAALPPAIRHYDIELVRNLDRILPREDGGLTRPAAAQPSDSSASK